MIFRIIIFFLLFSILLYAQEDKQNQSIELPEFVITGVESVTIPKTSKNLPRLIPVLSQYFFTPYISPEDLSLTNLSAPVSYNLLKEKKLNYINGQLEIGAGLQTLPVGLFNFQHSFPNILLYADVSGINIKNYISNAGYNETQLGGGANFYVGRKSSFLPDAKIIVNGNYKRNFYKLYGSSIPDFERNLDLFHGKISLSNFSNKKVNYSLNFGFNNLIFKENNLEELLLKSSLYLKYGSSKFAGIIEGEVNNQKLKNSFTFSDNNLFYNGKFSLLLIPSKSFELKLGAYYAKQDSNDFFAPTGAFTLKFDKNVVMIGEYKPFVEFNTIKNYLDINRFFMFSPVENIFTKHANNFSLATRYQYNKYFEIHGGIGYYKTDNYIMFQDVTTIGNFDLHTENEVTNIYGFFNFLFNRGPYGYFYGSVTLQEVKLQNDLQAPYKPTFKAEAIYGLDITEEFRFEINAEYSSKSFKDTNNIEQISDYINLGALLEYSMLENLTFQVNLQNILNRKNFLLHNYQEKPFDIIAGINYRW